MPANSILSVNESDYSGIDSRLKPFLKGWKIAEIYKGQTVNLPPDWNSAIFPFRYYEVIKNPGDFNYNADESENEICLSLWAGWKGYDDECEINLWITGKAVLDKTQTKISAEIYKTSGADMKLFYNNKLVTNFKSWLYKLDKVWTEDISKIQELH